MPREQWLDGPPRRFVSGLYRLAPSDAWPSREEGERRLRVKMRRLVTEGGVEGVVDRIRASRLGTEADRAWLVLTAYAEDKASNRQRGGTL